MLQGSYPVSGDLLLGDLLQPGDRNADFVTSNNCYSWYGHIGVVLRPKRILEFGVRYGYAIKSLINGSEQSPIEVWGFDDERDGVNTLDVFRTYFARHYMGSLVIEERNTQTLTLADVPLEMDVAHVDAWHTESGCYRECELALYAVRPGGFVLVDDANPGPVRDGAERLCRDHGLPFRFLPTLRGMLVFQKPE